MASPLLVDGTALELWARRSDAQRTLPEIIRRLIRATSKRVVRLHVPSGDQVQATGWDGIAAVEGGNEHVPDGMSLWEFGAGEQPKRKADSDFEKRTAQTEPSVASECTFIFVTPRRWDGRHAWTDENRALGLWRDVRAYDGTDLVAWLHSAPGVHVWLSLEMGHRPEGADDIDTFWRAWAAQTSPPTPPDLLLAGRDIVVDRIRSWLEAPSTCLRLQSGSKGEALAVFAASIRGLPPEEREHFASRTIVVHTPTAWDRQVLHPEQLFLVMAFDGEAQAIGRAAAQQHHVILGVGRSDTQSAVAIPRVRRDHAEKALITAGFPESKARRYAELARRSMTAFQRRLAIAPEIQQPDWARAPHVREVTPLFLVGAWKENSDGDRAIVEQLSGLSYGQVQDVVSQWATVMDPLFRRSGQVCYVASPEDSWQLLAQYLHSDDLRRFETVAVETLTAPDPMYDLSPNDWWRARATGEHPRYSDRLVRAVAETVAILASRPDAAPRDRLDTPAWGARIVRRYKPFIPRDLGPPPGGLLT